MKGLGYRQIAALLLGQCAMPEAIRRLKRDTRHFAKRQLTWFRKEPDIEWIRLQEQDSDECVLDRLLERVRRFLAGLSRFPSPVAERCSTLLGGR